MPWKQVSPESEQIRFIKQWQEGKDTFVDLCRQFNVSRKTGYKRIGRFETFGWEGLGDLSRTPHNYPGRTSDEVVKRVIEAKLAHPTWGPKKLVAWLRDREPTTIWPAPSTAGGILLEAGLVRPRKRRKRTVPWTEPFADALAPNDVWSIDIKGWFRTGDGVRIDPLTVQDAATRYLLTCHSLSRPNGREARKAMERTFREYGLPLVIRSDNGVPFASVGLGGLSALSVWWVKLGIIPERTEPAHPEQNGRLERLHRTLKAETASPPQPTVRKQQMAFDSFLTTYNHDRPHEALGQQPPARRYRSSHREYPSRLSSPEYDTGSTVRMVRTNGQIKWNGNRIYLSEALVGEPVALRPIDDRFWEIRFGPLVIGWLDSHNRCILQVPIKVLPMSPV